MRKWEKKKCYVVYAYYPYEMYENNESPLYEEEICISRAEAEHIASRYRRDSDIEDVVIEEEYRDILCD